MAHFKKHKIIRPFLQFVFSLPLKRVFNKPALTIVVVTLGSSFKNQVSYIINYAIKAQIGR